MNIGMSSIMSKVNAWTKTPEGKRHIEECIEKYRKEGRTTTAAGSKIINEQMMLEAASKFISVLRSTARDMDLPESVMRHFDSLSYSRPFKTPNGSTVIYVYFDDAMDGSMHRDSLMPERYDGVDNIIAVLNNGYSEHENMAKVWGEWHGARIHALTQRAGLRFVQQAVDDFNGSYGADYNVIADAGDEYT